MKKVLVVLLTVAMTLSMFASCSTPEKPSESAAPASSTPAASSEVSSALAAPVADGEVTLPTKGIGTQISTEVKAKEKYTIACIVKNSTNPYMVGCLNGVEKAAADMGFEAIVMAPSTNDSVEEQVKIMEDLIQKGVDGFVLVPVDTNGIMPGVRKAMEKNIPVATIGTPAAVDTFLRTGVDYTETGRVIGKAVAEKIGGKGEVIILEGPPGAQNAQERLAGIKEAMSAFPDIKIVASQTANFKRTEGMQVAENLLQKYKTVNAIIGCNDEMAIGAVQAIKAAGLEGKVVVAGFDGNQDGSSAIKDGSLYISYNTDPFGSSYLAATYIAQFLNDGTMPQKYFTPFPSEKDNPLITGENVDDYRSNIAWWNEVK
ncbi:sugar ABC transporter substrate-binding protein [Hydrogenoanaerobacterium sp.]|uniref:sugar ABC transporter substrate-binding protein n=1 Tax=Hydrogenoanaerobacterium sp. TaxID=2953763 RepID=UPI00289BB1AC|nr:sugar ABC transporter substrate-binding protein [Hydrogenoanaerobacterium sp.]